MKKIELKRRPYMRPEIRIIETNDEYLLLSTSMELNGPGSTEEDWDADEDINAGEVEI